MTIPLSQDRLWWFFHRLEHQARITLNNFEGIHFPQIQSINQLFGDNKTSSAVDTDLIINLFGFADLFSHP
jgi:hypothetical protein